MALCLVARAEGKTPRSYPLPNQRIHIGRSEENDIVLPSFSVSAHHATLSKTNDGFLLSDDGSKNGILVAGERVPSVLLTPMGVVALLGDTMLSIAEGETGEIRMALAVESDVAGRERDTESIPEPDAEMAMQVVTDVVRERLDGPQEALAQMQRLLRATSAQWIEITGRGDAAVVARVGRDVPAEVRQRLHSLGESPCWIERIGAISVIAAVVRRRRRRQMLFASFEGAPREFAGWEKTFFDSMGALLLEREVTVPVAIPAKPARKESSRPFIAESAAILTLVEQATRWPLPDDAILLVGESGTGKELMARHLHDQGPMANGDFLAVSCATWPEHLVDSMLVGVEKRTATEVDQRKGFFAAADGGTLFLDEIGELSDAMQGKLMRILQERTVMPLGSTKEHPFNVRIVAATDREERLRDPLRYRFRFRFRVPPLRERPDDIVPLVMRFVGDACRERRFARLGVSEIALQALRAYPWPGNVRQLESVVHAAVAASEGSGPLHLEHLQLPPVEQHEPLHEFRDDSERARILAVLDSKRGNKAAAARELGRSREWLRLAMRRLGLTAKPS